MKKIKNITVKVTYEVSLSNIEVKDEVYNDLLECYETGEDIDGDSCDTVMDFIDSYVHEDTCDDICFEIQDLDGEDA
jgi:hypothetical protein